MVDRGAFIEGMSHAVSTVSVLTTDGAAGRAGVTVSAMCSVCAEPMVLLDTPASRDYFLAMFRSHGLQARIGWLSSSFETVRGLVANGLGYALLVTKPANSMSYDGGALVSRPIAEPVPPSDIVVVPRARDATAALRDFAGHCREYFDAHDNVAAAAT